MKFSDEFDSIFGGTHQGVKILNVVRKIALSGALRASTLRSLFWRIFLNVLEPSDTVEAWVETVKRNREKFANDVAEVLQDPHRSAEGRPAEAAHPLAQDPDSPWAKYFERSELEQSIDLDVVRQHALRCVY